MHREAFDFIGSEVFDWFLTNTHPPHVLEFGSANINGSARELFKHHDIAAYLGIDLFDGPDVDEVADAATFVPPWPADIVICAEVLEHAPVPEAVVWNAHRALKPGGIFIMTCASAKRLEHSGIDGGDVLHPEEVYQRITMADVRRWMKPFSEVNTDTGRFGIDLWAMGVK